MRQTGLRSLLLLAIGLTVPLLAACDERKPAAAPAAKPAVGVAPRRSRVCSAPSSSSAASRRSTRCSCAPASRAFSTRCCSREGQDVKAGDLLYQIEKVQFQAQVDQAKANLAARRGRASTPSCNTTANRTGARTRTRRSPRSTRTRPTLDSAKATVLQTQAALQPRRRSTSATPTSGRRSTAASAAPPIPIGNLVNPASGVLGDDRQPGSDLRAVPGQRARARDIRERGARRTAAWSRSRSACAWPTARNIRIAGVWNFTDPQVDQTDRHA